MPDALPAEAAIHATDSVRLLNKITVTLYEIETVRVKCK